MKFDYDFTEFVPKGPNDRKAALVWIMAWCRIGEKPSSEPVLARFTDAYIHDVHWRVFHHLLRPNQNKSLAVM